MIDMDDRDPFRSMVDGGLDRFRSPLPPLPLQVCGNRLGLAPSALDAIMFSPSPADLSRFKLLEVRLRVSFCLSCWLLAFSSCFVSC